MEVQKMENNNGNNNGNYIDNSSSEFETNQAFENAGFQTEKNESAPKTGKGLHKKIASYIIVGLICSMVSGVASGAAVMYWLPKSGSASQAQTTQSSSNSTVYYKTTPLSTTAGSLSVTEIAKKVGPAVVGVSVKTADSTDQFGFPVDGEEGMGSGIIFNEDGYILTNYHVVDGASKITVIFNNKKEVGAKVVNYNSDLDLAVIKVTENVKMPAVAEFGNSKDVQVGEPVVAIGNPLGKELLGTVTAGVISAANRQIQVGNSTQTLLQTDAAINPGNSGGALVNEFGQVIGINSSKISESGVEGLGFAIPIDVVKPQINSLLKPILLIGISCRDITSDIAKRYNMPEGVYVAQVQQYSAAEKAGIQAGDVIVKFDGKEVKTTSSMNTLKSSHKSGDVVSIQVYRDGKYMNLTLKLSE
jgi:serine protease Do